MVCSGALTGLFLIFLVCPNAEARIMNLQRITRFLQRNYSDGGQVAVAINIPATMCSSQKALAQDFLQDDPAWRVKHAISGTSGIYRGHQLIAARSTPINGESRYDPEYLLLIQANPPNNSTYDPPLKKLLDKDKSGCVVFYTFNSPCVNNCSTPEDKSLHPESVSLILIG
ncbi:uncharacterized protein [Salminus brasiliensis]|uniref:uncharacterized protein isoform X2 n=1 Tax=Salminus brasiliensis TaxID=930266 RepID=UPI003B83A307